MSDEVIEPVVPAVAPATNVVEPALGVQPVAAPAQPKKADDPLADPRVQAEIRKREEAAKLSGKKEAETAAQLTAERAQMVETDRLRLEKSEADAAVLTANSLVAELNTNLGIANTLLHNKLVLSDESSLAFLQFQVAKELKTGATTEQAIASVIEKHAYLVKPTVATVATTVAAEPPTITTVIAPAPKVTQTPAHTAPQTVDVASMTKAEYQAYKRKTHGIG